MNETKLKKDSISLSDELHISRALAHDLLVLAGGDVDLVMQASNKSMTGIESVKAMIIDQRFEKIEESEDEADNWQDRDEQGL